MTQKITNPTEEEWRELGTRLKIAYRIIRDDAQKFRYDHLHTKSSAYTGFDRVLKELTELQSNLEEKMFNQGVEDFKIFFGVNQPIPKNEIIKLLRIKKGVINA
jgi:hypothetical protein